MSSITSEEVNYLIYRYLQEAGFLHSAYCFGQESFISKADIKAANVAPGSLIALLQKGLHYVSIETHLNDDGSEKECTRTFSLLEPHVCEKPTGVSGAPSSSSMSTDDVQSLSAMLPSARGSYDREPGIPIAMTPAIATNDPIFDADEDGHGKKSKHGSKKSKKKARSPDAMEIDSSGPSDEIQMDEEVTFLRDGLKSNITNFACAPLDRLTIGMGTGDGWLQLWRRESTSKTLALTKEFDFSQSGDITTINWRSDGQYLSVASVNGTVHLVDGTSFSDKQFAAHHKGPVFAAKWSPSGSYLLTAGLDQTSAVWDINNSKDPPKRIYRHHRGPVMDVDWRTDDSFATCSVDHTIAVYNNWIEQTEPVQVFTGHEDEVNSIAWDPTRTILASCSDDCTARLWRTSQSSALHTLSDHKKEIYAIRWSPVESRSGSHWLATASLDTTVRLWDAESGKCVRTLAKHSDAVYAVAFSPDGDYLATGARDSAVHIWSLKEGMVTRSFHAGPGGVLDLSWTKDGRSLIAASANDICVFDMPSTTPL